MPNAESSKWGSAKFVAAQIFFITAHFFKAGDWISGNDFKDKVLHTSWCSFANKRTLTLKIVKDRNMLDTPKQSRLVRLLRKAMSHRNAFTHGTFTIEGKRIFFR